MDLRHQVLRKTLKREFISHILRRYPYLWLSSKINFHLLQLKPLTKQTSQVLTQAQSKVAEFRSSILTFITQRRHLRMLKRRKWPSNQVLSTINWIKAILGLEMELWKLWIQEEHTRTNWLLVARTEWINRAFKLPHTHSRSSRWQSNSNCRKYLKHRTIAWAWVVSNSSSWTSRFSSNSINLTSD